jgi:uncharacterized protein involved in exopolysaccharide biosynthesis
MQSQRIGDGIRAAQDRKLLLQKQQQDYEILVNTAAQSLAAQEEAAQAMSSPTPAYPPASAAKPRNPYEAQLEQYRNHLSDLQAKYTEKHPDILVAKKKIADLEAKKAQFEAAQAEAEMEEQKKALALAPAPAPAEPSTAKRGISLDSRLMNPRYKELENQVVSVNLEIARLRQDDLKIRNQIVQYRQRIENTPSREQALAVLTRDYNNTREVYSSLLNKTQAAQQAENLERRQKGEQFKIIDPARIPEKPYRPDITKILLIGVFLGFFGGAAVAFFREQMDRSFRDAEDLQVALGFKVLANIPRIGFKAN